jgi:hypothetical protein
MKRPLRTSLTLLSLLLLVAVAWLIRPRGQRVDTCFHRTAGGQYYVASVYPGKVSFGRSTGTTSLLWLASASPPRRVPWGHNSGRAGGWSSPSSRWNRLGFWHFPRSAWIVNENMEMVTYEQWVVPKWFVLLVMAVPVAGLAAARFLRRRRGSGLCPECGYDLRASPEQCPECGTMAAARPG